MRITWNLLFCLAGGLALNMAVHADDAVLPGNPYAPVVTRNIFGLNPPAPVDPNAQADATPPPKITPNGIMSIFGQLQVLFKVANPAKDGKPAADADYILSEGQRQDDIEVVKIDEKAGVVTFNNHGENQELPLVAAAATGSPGSAAGGGPGNPAPGFKPAPGGFTRPMGNTFNGGGGSSLAGNFGGNRGNGNNGMNGGGNGGNNPGGLGNGLNFGNGPTHASSLIQQPSSGLTEEQQILVQEATRVTTQQQVNEGSMPPLPPTEMTPPDATGIGGRPLVVPSPGVP